MNPQSKAASTMHAEVTGLHIYPIKSCAGIEAPAVEWSGRGLARDREWMVVDANGQFLTQRTLPRMALIKTALSDGQLRCSVPDQSEILEVSLDERDRPRRQVRIWGDDLEALDEGPLASAWFTDFLGQPAHLVRFDPAHRRLSDPGWTRGVDAENRFSDAFPVLVIGEESLEALNFRLDEPLPMNRFRPNIVIRGLGAHGEDQTDVLAGDGFEIHLVKPCVRCLLTTNDQATAVMGKEPLRTLAAYRRDATLNGITFGMNGLVTAHPGTRIAVGMPLRAGARSR